jgi:hypothetical protein
VSKEHDVPADGIVIEDIVIRPGSKKGDGFACDIAAVEFQATFEGKKIEKNYIAKYAPEGNRGQLLKVVMKTFTILRHLNLFL